MPFDTAITIRLLLAGCCAVLLPVASGAAELATVRSDVPANMAAFREVPAPAADDAPLTVTLVLPLRDPKGAAAFARSVSTPRDPLEGHFLTPSEFADRFGPSQADYDFVVAWAQSMGLSVHEKAVGRTTLAVSAPASQLGRALAVGFKYYARKDGSVFASATGKPRIQAATAARLLGVVGLSKATQFAPLVQRRPALAAPQAGTGVGGGYTPADLRTAYNTPLPDLHYSKENVAVFEQGGFYKSDLAVFAKKNGITAPPVVVRSVDNYGGGVDDPNVELESVLDIDMLIGMNPTVAQVTVYEDGLDFSTALLDGLAAMASDDTAKIISISYGLDEVYVGTTAMDAENQVLIQLAAQGQSVLASSGDGGAYARSQYGLNVEDPGSQPFITAVGGTDLYTNPNGTWLAEQTWNDLGHYGGASGGGVSSYWALPAYQVQPGETVSVAHGNGGSDSFRNIPDISAVGGPLTGAAIYSGINGGWLTIGGTSLSAPIYAGVLSIYDQLRNTAGFGHLGFFNPALYNLGTTLGGYYSFHDVRDGSNGNLALYGIPGYDAGFNFDDATGWGTPNGTTMIFDLLTNAQSGTNPPAPPSGVTGHLSRNSAVVRWTAAPAASGYGITVYDAYTGALLTSGFTRGTSIAFPKLLGTGAYAFYVASLTRGGTTYAAPIYLK